MSSPLPRPGHAFQLVHRPAHDPQIQRRARPAVVPHGGRQHVRRVRTPVARLSRAEGRMTGLQPVALRVPGDEHVVDGAGHVEQPCRQFGLDLGHAASVLC